MQKSKNLVKRFIKKDSFLYKKIGKTYHVLSKIKFKTTNYKQIKKQRKYFSEQVKNALEIIKKYKNENYVILYNPTWLGVANSTKGLFKILYLLNMYIN